ncbi:hypothetical protein KGP24_24535 (plasmid) [Enterobacter sp. JBIWA008]|uniref:hypothetical protein n=1 Tax=Enterobacter sp. JBIWA008 TaxID=2831892 RepID=UPI001CBC41EC|nr:hypothetical protein [Enterobacter sp. JBIWA008]UAN43468.1 hypothetical protein KGP24_24535 [Enterobacter sp. JBIWA008]
MTTEQLKTKHRGRREVGDNVAITFKAKGGSPFLEKEDSGMGAQCHGYIFPSGDHNAPFFPEGPNDVLKFLLRSDFSIHHNKVYSLGLGSGVPGLSGTPVLPLVRGTRRNVVRAGADASVGQHEAARH